MKQQQKYVITKADNVGTGIDVSFRTPAGRIKRKYYRIRQRQDDVIKLAKKEMWQPNDFEEHEGLEEV